MNNTTTGTTSFFASKLASGFLPRKEKQRPGRQQRCRQASRSSSNKDGGFFRPPSKVTRSPTNQPQMYEDKPVEPDNSFFSFPLVTQKEMVDETANHDNNNQQVPSWRTRSSSLTFGTRRSIPAKNPRRTIPKASRATPTILLRHRTILTHRSTEEIQQAAAFAPIKEEEEEEFHHPLSMWQENGVAFIFWTNHDNEQGRVSPLSSVSSHPKDQELPNSVAGVLHHLDDACSLLTMTTSSGGGGGGDSYHEWARSDYSPVSKFQTMDHISTPPLYPFSSRIPCLYAAVGDEDCF